MGDRYIATGAMEGFTGAAESDGFSWKTALLILLIIVLVWAVWSFSSPKTDRICISSDVRDYWPSFVPDGGYSLPKLSSYMSTPAAAAV